MVDLTARVAEIVARAESRLCNVTCRTAAVVVNENGDPASASTSSALVRLIGRAWRHDRIDGNAARIQATILGPGETIPVRQYWT
jgi:thiamine phosphate synthase YjbQ (UPF0047 family)